MVFAVVAAFVFGIATTCIMLARAAFLAGEMGWKEIRPDHVTQSFLVPGWALGTFRLLTSLFQGAFILHCARQPAHHVACTLGGGCVPFGGLNLWATFTVWCWTGQVFYFFLSGLACVVGDRMRHFRFGLFFIWVLYEVMFSMALMVTLTVWFVLVPHLHVGTYLGIPEAGQGLGIMYSLFGFVTHVLNLVFMFTELALNRLSFKDTHVFFCLLAGVSYLLFSWVFHAYTRVWFYFFLDYEPIYAVIPYMICCGVVYCYFVFGGWCSDLLKAKQHPKAKQTSSLSYHLPNDPVTEVAAKAETASGAPAGFKAPVVPKLALGKATGLNPGLTKPTKIKRHDTISSVLFLAREDSGVGDPDLVTSPAAPPKARPGMDTEVDRGLRLR